MCMVHFSLFQLHVCKSLESLGDSKCNNRCVHDRRERRRSIHEVSISISHFPHVYLERYQHKCRSNNLMLLHIIKLQKLIHPLFPCIGPWKPHCQLVLVLASPERKRERGEEEYLQLLVPFLVSSDDTVCGQTVKLCCTDHSTGLLLLL
jgi:hypothetical protein